jgi:hypothetical protein
MKCSGNGMIEKMGAANKGSDATSRSTLFH